MGILVRVQLAGMPVQPPVSASPSPSPSLHLSAIYPDYDSRER